MSTLDADSYQADDLLDDGEDPPRGWLQRVWRFIRNQSNRVLLLTGVVLFTLAYFWPEVQ